MPASSLIGALRYDIIADTSRFQQGMVGTKKEIAAAKRVISETRTPLENMQMEMQGLNQLFRKGAIDAETYRRSIERVKREQMQATGGIAGMKAALASASASMKGFIAASLGIGGVLMAVRGLTAQLDEMDMIIKRSRALGIMTDDLITLRMATAQLTSMQDIDLDRSLRNMQTRIAEIALTGKGEAADALELMGLKAKDLMDMGPVNALKAMADQFQRLDDQTQLFLGKEFFGGRGVHFINVLKAGSEGIEAFRAKAEEAGLFFDGDAANGIEETNDAIDDMKNAFKGLGRELTTTLVPAIRFVVDDLAILARDFNKFIQSIKDIGTGLGNLSMGFNVGPDGRITTKAGDQQKRSDSLDAKLRTATQEALDDEKKQKAEIAAAEKRREERKAKRRQIIADQELEKAAKKRKEALAKEEAEKQAKIDERERAKADREKQRDAERAQREAESEAARIKREKDQQRKQEIATATKGAQVAQRGSVAEYRLIAQATNKANAEEAQRHEEAIRKWVDIANAVADVVSAVKDIQMPEPV